MNIGDKVYQIDHASIEDQKTEEIPGTYCDACKHTAGRMINRYRRYKYGFKVEEIVVLGLSNTGIFYDYYNPDNEEIDLSQIEIAHLCFEDVYSSKEEAENDVEKRNNNIDWSEWHNYSTEIGC